MEPPTQWFFSSNSVKRFSEVNETFVEQLVSVYLEIKISDTYLAIMFW